MSDYNFEEMIKKINEFNLFATVYPDGQFGLLARNQRGEFYAFGVSGEMTPDRLALFINNEKAPETWFEVEIYKAGFIKIPKPTKTKEE